ncbi:hypothetical protein [Saccharothrix obliqua]|uniref:hypothetical protein n=1 Tax=Saccharothrix obliqua TaxID=2861747 RepID=UPI0021510328|nr:hypothetical protein [Saccharothrix obliqua]
MIQDRPVWLNPSSSLIVGSATFMIVVSSWSMNSHETISVSAMRSPRLVSALPVAVIPGMRKPL